MPQVVQIQRQPNSWEQGGQSIQQTADNFLKSMLAMGQMQGNNALHMATLNMQNQRLADANVRDDKRWAEQQAAQERRFAQDDKWKAQELGIRRSELGLHQQALAEKNYGRDFIRSLLGGVNAGAQPNTGLDTATTAGMNEVLSPNWSPTSGGVQGSEQNNVPSMYDNGVKAGLINPVPSMAETAKRTGLFPQFSDSPTVAQAETTPLAQQASMAPPAQAQLPADSGKLSMPKMPERASIVIQGVPFTVDTFPPAFSAIPEGQRIFEALKAKQEMLNHQYDLEMKAYKENTKQDQPLPFDQATKLANLKESYNQIQSLAGGLFDANGNFNRMDSAKSNVPGTPEYQYKVKAEQAVEAWLRAMTGAAVTKEESARYAQMYIPMPWDNGNVALDKLSRLEGNYTGTLKEMGRQGSLPPSTVEDVKARKSSIPSSRPPISSF